MKTLRWYDWLQYVALLSVAVTVPVGWHFGLWTSVALGGATIIKMVMQRRVGNPALSWPLRWTMAGALFYYLVLAISLLWSRDIATGVEVLNLKAVLLIFPCCFLLSDTSCFTPRHLRGIGYALLVGVVGAFLYFLVNAGIEMHKGVEFVAFKNGFFVPERRLVYHHAYIALYAVVAMAFGYHELWTHWKEMKWWLRGLLILAIVLLIAYTVLVNSRAGMLAMGLTAVACVVHFTLIRRDWKLGLLIAVLVAGGIVAAMKLMPGYVDRLTSTVENVEDDARTSINRSNFHALMQSPLVGYGVGDYHAVQVEQYGKEEFSAGTSAEYNAHNQYLESLLAAGIPALLSLLFFLLAPVFLAWRRKSRYLFLLALCAGIVLFNLLFESMLERQMGLLFIGPLFAVMVLILSVEENKFARLEKK